MSETTSHRVPAVVLGGFLTALGVVRSLGRRGIPLYLVSEAPDFSARSRWARRFPADTLPPHAPDNLDAMLSAMPLAEAVLIPCSDHWTRAVVNMVPPGDRTYRTSLPSPETHATLCDKKTLSATLRRLGIHQPRTAPVATEAELASLMGDGARDWFLKPCDSQAFRQRFGCKAFRVDSVPAAAARLAEIVEAGLEALLQEYVPGGADQHHFVDGFIDARGRIRALFARQRGRMYPPDFGDSSFMTSEPLAAVAEAEAAVRTLFADVPYRGIFSVEFKRDPRDGHFRLIEVNTRPWSFNEFAARCGVDTTVMAYRDALGEPVPEVARYAEGRSTALLPEDLAAAVASIRRGEMGVGDWLRDVLRSDWSLFRWDDPLPDLSRHAATFLERLRR
jgi:predicted ATP-grasp superfamily ATP-dependent carboligase